MFSLNAGAIVNKKNYILRNLTQKKAIFLRPVITLKINNLAIKK